jgi:hypothetical protein
MGTSVVLGSFLETESRFSFGRATTFESESAADASRASFNCENEAYEIDSSSAEEYVRHTASDICLSHSSASVVVSAFNLISS